MGGFTYCPFCGSSLNVFKTSAAIVCNFCPFCGQKLTVDNPSQGDIDTGLGQEPLVHELLKQQILESSTYSVVLKTCPDKERLARLLQQHLLRSCTAIRLAVETVPSVIIYKGRAEEIRPVLKAIYHSGAIIGLTCGDITANNLNSLLDKSLGETKKLLEEVPSTLWLGDNIVSIASGVLSGNNSGCLVISDQAVYFVYKGEDERPHWEVIPYYLIANFELTADGRGIQMAVREENCPRNFATATKYEGKRIYSEVAACQREERYRHKLKISCVQCHMSEIRSILDNTIPNQCSSCRGNLHISLLCYN